MIVAPYIVAGFVVLVGTVALYFSLGGIAPHNLGEWSNFGTYVGGIAGPLLSFVALIAVARTMHLQRATLELDQAQRLADQHLRWLDALYNDIVEALDARISPDVALRAVLNGDVEVSGVDRKRLTARLDNLMQLLAQYCRAVALYRDNISEFYDLQIYADRGGRLLDAIKPFHSYLSGMFLPTIEFCDMHLRGETERAKPEAMTRSSRRP
jgi:hypothetical protein